MLVKPFKDDLSWNVQRTLVNAYFAVKNQQQTTAIEEKPTLEFETDWFCINRGKSITSAVATTLHQRNTCTTYLKFWEERIILMKQREFTAQRPETGNAEIPK